MHDNMVSWRYTHKYFTVLFLISAVSLAIQEDLPLSKVKLVQRTRNAATRSRHTARSACPVCECGVRLHAVCEAGGGGKGYVCDASLHFWWRLRVVGGP